MEQGYNRSRCSQGKAGILEKVKCDIGLSIEGDESGSGG